MTHNVADCIGAIGASGTGKGLFVTAKVAPLLGRRLVLVWSPLELTDRYAQKFAGVTVRSIPHLVGQVKAKARAIVFVPDGNAKKLAAQFDLFCRVAWYAPRCVAVIEELSRVTTPGWAPQAWQNLSTAGRHQGLTVIATAQRPAQIDKDFLGNCTEVRAYRVNYDNDAKALASIMRERPEFFLELPDRHYLHRWIRERRNERGVQPLPGEAPAPPPAAAKVKKIHAPKRSRPRNRNA